MNTRARTAAHATKAVSKHDKEMGKGKNASVQGNNNRSMTGDRGFGKRQSRRERKIALQQDVDKLRKKLRHEENVHRALERAFTRPLGALPRLPPYLPTHTQELLAEVAVLEEEVARLEEQVVNFQQGLYQEAIYLNSSKKAKENGSEQLQPFHNLACDEASGNANPAVSMRRWSLESVRSDISTINFSPTCKQSGKKLNSSLTSPEDRRGKENQLNANFSGSLKPSTIKKVSRTRVSAQEVKEGPALKEYPTMDKGDQMGDSIEAAVEESSVTNKLSEDILRCLNNIFLGINPLKNSEEDPGTSLSVSGSNENSKRQISETHSL